MKEFCILRVLLLLIYLYLCGDFLFISNQWSVKKKSIQVILWNYECVINIKNHFIYERAAFSQTVNLQISKIFGSRNVLTINAGCSRYRQIFRTPFYDRQEQKIFLQLCQRKNLKEDKFMKIGCEVLIKYVLQSIFIYFMSFSLPLYLFVMKLKEWWISFDGVIREVKVEVLILG